MQEKVLVLCITKDHVDPMGFESIVSQDYDNFSFIVHAKRPKHYHPNSAFNKHLNCSDNRNDVRKIALNSDANWFLFIDSDMVFPKDMIKTLMIQTHTKKEPAFPQSVNRKREHRVIGGWYKQSGGRAYVGGRFVDDHLFQHYYEVHRGLVQTDLIGMGCVLMHREVLSTISFGPGIDKEIKLTGGGNSFLGECMKFSSDAIEKGYRLFLTGDVVCTHNPRSF